MQWSPVTKTHFAVFTAAIAVLAVLELLPPVGWVPILDGANLLFHEAGHPIFGIFGETMGLYGGTIGQLVFPVVVIIEFWRRHATMSLAVGGVWFFQNFFNIARYVADARAQVLPLVGGGDHDWTNILWRWGVLHHDVTIGTIIATVGAMCIVAIWAWVGWRCFHGRKDSAVRS